MPLLNLNTLTHFKSARKHVMNALNCLRRQAICHVTATRTLRWVSAPPAMARSITSQPKPPLRSLGTSLFRQPLQRRYESIEAAKARSPARLYPEWINVYRAGTPATMAVGMARMATIILWAVGAIHYAPAFYFSPDHSNWWIPVFAIVAGTPFVVTALTTSAMAHAVRVNLPSRARRNKEELKRFSKWTPGETIVELHYMGWMPFLSKRRMRFDRLRRLTPSFQTGTANLEHVPEATEELKNSVWGRTARRLGGLFHVNRDQRNDRSAVPGVWDGMWEQIPYKGSENDPEAHQKRHTGPMVREQRLPTLKPVSPSSSSVAKKGRK